MARKRRVVVAGQVPPPVGGQNIMIAQTIEDLISDGRFRVDHLPFYFTRGWDAARSVGLWKVREAMAVIWRLALLRARGPIDLLLFPAGGPHVVPVWRDIILLPWFHLLSKCLVLNFHAGGIADALPRFGGPMRWLATKVYHASEAAVVLTNFGRRDPEFLAIARIEVVPNVIPDTFDPALVNRKDPRTRFLYVGHLSHEKRTRDLLRAFVRVAAADPDLELILVGEPLRPYTRDDIESFSESTGVSTRIRITGLLDGEDKWREYGRASLFVFPSTAAMESYPLVLLEAMMWGLPIVAADWRANAEILGQPVGGICFEPGEDFAGRLAGALSAAMDAQDQWPDWGARNRRRFLDLTEENLGGLADFIAEFLDN